MPVAVPHWHSREPRSHRLSLVGRGTHVSKVLSEHENERNALRISPVDLEACRLNEADVSHEASTTLVDTFADDRALPIVSFPELLPITSFNEDKNQQAMIWADCYRALFRVWYAGCKFMAIGVHSLMVNPDTNRGILIDLDLPVGFPEHGIRDLRTGYAPFMSLDLLTDGYFDGELEVVRLYRHDAESFIWAMALLFLDDAYPSLVKPWSTADYNVCRMYKRDFLSKLSHHMVAISKGPNASDKRWSLARRLLHHLEKQIAIGERQAMHRVMLALDDSPVPSLGDAEQELISMEPDLQSDAYAYFQTFDECVRTVLVDLSPMDTEFLNVPFTASA